MSQLTYRTTVYRGCYATFFVGIYLFLVAYMLSGDDGGSSSNSGVWAMLVGLVIFALAGTLAGPALHRRLFMEGSTRHSMRTRHRGHYKNHKG